MLNHTTTSVRAGQAAHRAVATAYVITPESNSVAVAAQGCLRASGYFEVRILTCEHHEGVLLLRGQVSLWHHKQLAQEAVRHMPGVKAVINVVDVVAPNQSERRPGILMNDSDACPVEKHLVQQIQG